MAKEVTNHELCGWVPVDCPQNDNLTQKQKQKRQEYDDDEPARLGMAQNPGFYQTVAKELRGIPAAMFRTEVMKIIEPHEEFGLWSELKSETWRWRWWCHLPDLTDHGFLSIQLLDAMMITARRAAPNPPRRSSMKADLDRMNMLRTLIVVIILAANFILQPGSFGQKLTCLSCNLWNFIFLPIVMWRTSYFLQYSARNFNQLAVKIMQKERLTEAVGDDRTLTELRNSLANELDTMAPETIKWVLRELPFASVAHFTRKFRQSHQNVDIDEETVKIFEENPYFQAFYKLLTMKSPQVYSSVSNKYGVFVAESVVGVSLAYLLTYGIQSFKHLLISDHI